MEENKLTYDFDKIISRRNTNSEKWDMLLNVFGNSDVLPLWVADMYFEAPPEISQSIKQRAEHSVYGYTAIPDSCYEAILNWLKNRHGWQVDREWISFSHGVIPSLCAAIMAFTKPVMEFNSITCLSTIFGFSRIMDVVLLIINLDA